ncbi:MAG: class I SAM-dependent methyltransferase [Treponema sp.]|nr:class I SAM-dependent methyltransferase [Treponema sp.]
MEKLHIEKNSVQETLIIPLYARYLCSKEYPDLFKDQTSERLINAIDYDASERGKLMDTFYGKFGALECAQREYDLCWEIKEYLKTHPKAAVVNLGAGLLDIFSRVDNGTCLSYNIDFPEVIDVRNQLLPAGEREKNIACNLNDYRWFEEINDDGGAVFIGAGLFYYFTRDDVRKLITGMSSCFKDGVIVFDACNKRALKLMLKTWVKDAGISNIKCFFSIKNAEKELLPWSLNFKSVSCRPYMNGYRDISDRAGKMYKFMSRLADSSFKMQIVKIAFK